MPILEKKERNAWIVELRKKDPKHWTFARLASFFNVDRANVFRIVKRYEK